MSVEGAWVGICVGDTGVGRCVVTYVGLGEGGGVSGDGVGTGIGTGRRRLRLRLGNAEEQMNIETPDGPGRKGFVHLQFSKKTTGA